MATTYRGFVGRKDRKKEGAGGWARRKKIKKGKKKIKEKKKKEKEKGIREKSGWVE